MPAGRYDLVIERGATWLRTFTYEVPKGTPFNLTGYRADMWIKESYDADDKDTLIQLDSDEGGGIVLGGEAGTLEITIDAEDTLLDIENGVWDLVIDKDDVRTRILEGNVKIKRGVTGWKSESE